MKRTQWKDEQVPRNSGNLLDTLRLYSLILTWECPMVGGIHSYVIEREYTPGLPNNNPLIAMSNEQ